MTLKAKIHLLLHMNKLYIVAYTELSWTSMETESSCDVNCLLISKNLGSNETLLQYDELWFTALGVLYYLFPEHPFTPISFVSKK